MKTHTNSSKLAMAAEFTGPAEEMGAKNITITFEDGVYTVQYQIDSNSLDAYMENAEL